MVQYTNGSSNNDTPYPIATTVVKALTIIEYIASHQPVQPVKMVRDLQLTRANLHRLLATLVRTGYVEKTSSGYQLSLKLFQLGSTVPVKVQLRELARSHMHDLERIARENIYLTVLYNDQVIAIEEVKSAHTVILNPDVIYTYPVNSCASGKMLISSLSAENLDAYIENLDMIAKTEHTVTDKAEFKRQVLEARENGYAIELLEFGNHLNSIAAPICDREGEVIATIGISGPSMRLTEARIMELIEPLKNSAALITEKLINKHNKAPLW
ncbi:MAG: IclR family transcriptional regulator [Sphaerochaetaceae bacterium]|nr:IclR family transcriptional regulator [Sphaerochaetaceae bacterium]